MSMIQHVSIEKVVMEDVPFFTPPPVRGYNLMSDGNALNAISGINNRYKGSVTANALANAISSVVVLDEPSVVSPIAGGWGATRCSVSVDVLAIFTSGIKTRFRFLGYTDKRDHQYNGIANADTVIFINSIEKFRVDQQGFTPYGLADVSQAYYSTDGSNNLSTVRPSDVISDMSSRNAIEMDSFFSTDDSLVVDTGVSALSHVPALANRYVTTAPNWLATMLNARVSAMADTGLGTNIKNMATATLSYLHDPLIEDNEFLTMLARAMNSYSSSSGWFRFGDLCRLDPGLATDSNRNIHITNSRISSESENLDSLSIHASIAQMVASQVTPYMYETGIAACAFTCTNMTISGIASFTYNGDISLLYATSQLHTPEIAANRFKALICDILLPQLSRNNLMEVSITVSASHVSSIVVNVTVGQTFPQRFAFASFASNTFSPIISARGALDVGEAADSLFTGLDVLSTPNTQIALSAAQMPSLAPQQPMALSSSFVIYDV